MKRDSQKFNEQLRKLNFLRIRVLVVGVSYLPFKFLTLWLSSLGNETEKLVSCLTFCYFLFLGYCLLILGFAKCPKCQGGFFAKMSNFEKSFILSNPFSGKCMDCGLELRKKRGKNAKAD